MKLPFLVSKWLIFSSTLSGIILVSFADLNSSSLLNYQNNLDSTTSTLADSPIGSNSASVEYETKSNTKTQYNLWTGYISESGSYESTSTWSNTRTLYTYEYDNKNIGDLDSSGKGYLYAYVYVELGITWPSKKLNKVSWSDSCYQLGFIWSEIKAVQSSYGQTNNRTAAIVSYILSHFHSVETRKVLSSSVGDDLTSSQSIPIASGTYQVFNNNISINFN